MERWAEVLERYRADSTPENLKELSSVPPYELRKSLVAIFREHPTWRRAQHLALLWMNVLGPGTDAPDLVRADYFAWQGCLLSENDPRAMVVRAMVLWERRLSLAVIQETERAESRISIIDDKVEGKSVRSNLLTLRGKAIAYEGRVVEAATLLDTVEAKEGALFRDAMLQLFLSSRPQEHPEIEFKTAAWLARYESMLAIRPRRRLEKVVRGGLVRVLKHRANTR